MLLSATYTGHILGRITVPGTELDHFSFCEKDALALCSAQRQTILLSYSALQEW